MFALPHLPTRSARPGLKAAGFATLALLALSGCTTPPGLNDRLSAADRAAPYPALLPSGQIRAAIPGAPRLQKEDDSRVLARAEALRRRADALRNADLGG